MVNFQASPARDKERNQVDSQTCAQHEIPCLDVKNVLAECCQYNLNDFEGKTLTELQSKNANQTWEKENTNTSKQFNEQSFTISQTESHSRGGFMGNREDYVRKADIYKLVDLMFEFTIRNSLCYIGIMKDPSNLCKTNEGYVKDFFNSQKIISDIVQTTNLSADYENVNDDRINCIIQTTSMFMSELSKFFCL